MCMSLAAITYMFLLLAQFPVFVSSSVVWHPVLQQRKPCLRLLLHMQPSGASDGSQPANAASSPPQAVAADGSRPGVVSPDYNVPAPVAGLHHKCDYLRNLCSNHENTPYNIVVRWESKNERTNQRKWVASLAL